MKTNPLLSVPLCLLTVTVFGCPTRTINPGDGGGTGGSGGGAPQVGDAGAAGSPPGGSSGVAGAAGSGQAGAQGKTGSGGASGGSGSGVVGTGGGILGGAGGAAGSAFGGGGAGSNGTAGTVGAGGTLGGSGGSGGAACTNDPDCLSTDFCADGTCHHRVAQIACGASTTCVLLNDGSIRCAGLNASGELGNGTLTTTTSAGINTAVKVVGLPSNDTPQQVTPGGAHTCALLTSGGVYCWGDGSYGQRGDGSFNSSTSPVKIPLPSAASKIASGDQFLCAALVDGSVWCWGADYFGELGDGTYTNGRNNQAKPSPVQVGTTLFTSPDALIASTTTAHVMVGFQIFSWGEDKWGELGTGSPTTSSPFGSATPVSTPYAGQAVAISAASSGDHACMLTNHGIIRCWGNNDYGQLGDGSFAGVGATPNTVTGLTGTPSAVFAGGSHTCAIMSNGDFDCWGDDSYGELGDGVFRDTSMPVTSPSKATVVPSTPVSAALGSNHTCVLLKNGSVWCWGANGNGQLGNGMFIDSPTAVRMTGW